MRQANTGWKWAIGLFSLLLTILIWQRGLQESFERPSVAPKISLIQTEMAVSASSSLPESIKDIFIGPEPQKKLYKALQNLSYDQIDERQRLLLAVLEESKYEQELILNRKFEDEHFEQLRNYILEKNEEKKVEEVFNLNQMKLDPLLYQVYCTSLGISDDYCFDKRYNFNTALRLILSQMLPLIASFLGSILLIRQAFIFIRKKNNPWPEIIAPPLLIVDMVLLIAGGFVVIGEVVLPAFVIPIFDFFLKDLSSPLNESLKVLIGYCSMTIGPLIIIKYQLKSVIASNLDGGWLQWKIKPLKESIIKSISGWLMIMPLVLLVGWVLNEIIGDQGGSNPLLDLVLSSNEIMPLLLLFITTVVLAPVFEELVFRGILLPVLISRMGKIIGLVLSALIFALAHLSVGELIPLFTLGIGLGLMRLSSGRLLPCALMHSLWNGVTFASLLLVA